MRATLTPCPLSSRAGPGRFGEHYRIVSMQALGLVWGNVDPLTADLQELRTPIEKPTQFGGQLLLEHWRAGKANGGFAVGRDVPSRGLACVLRNLALYEPIGTDFRVRLAGMAFLRRFGRDITGLRFSEIYAPRNFEMQRDNMLDIIDRREPRVVDVTLARDARVYLRFEKVRLPVWAPNRKSTWVLGGLFCIDGA